MLVAQSTCDLVPGARFYVTGAGSTYPAGCSRRDIFARGSTWPDLPEILYQVHGSTCLGRALSGVLEVQRARVRCLAPKESWDGCSARADG